MDLLDSFVKPNGNRGVKFYYQEGEVHGAEGQRQLSTRAEMSLHPNTYLLLKPPQLHLIGMHTCC